MGRLCEFRTADAGLWRNPPAIRGLANLTNRCNCPPDCRLSLLVKFGMTCRWATALGAATELYVRFPKNCAEYGEELSSQEMLGWVGSPWEKARGRQDISWTLGTLKAIPRPLGEVLRRGE